MSGLVKRSNTLFFNKRKQTTFDWKFMDGIIREGFYIGGTDLHVYKYIGNYNQYETVVSKSNPDQSFESFSTPASHRGVEKAFDGNMETYYRAASNSAAENEYIIVDFGESQEEGNWPIINGFGIRQHDLHSNPTGIVVHASQNGISWADLDLHSLSDSPEMQRFVLDNETRYRFYKFIAKGPTFGTAYLATPPEWTVKELELYSESSEGGACGVQDRLFMESRDRKYDASGCTLLCHYEIPEKPHDLSAYGFIIPSDQLEITVLRSDTELELGRLLRIGDIVTLPHVTDDSHDEGGEIDEAEVVLPKQANQLDGRRYSVVDVSIKADGYDPRWRDHLQRLVVAPLKDSQETYDITGDPNDADRDGDRDYLMDISDAIHREASNAGEHGQDMSNIAHPSDTLPEIGPYTMDAIPPNNEPYTSGVDFPSNPATGDWFQHTGYDPMRLYKFSGSRWVRFEIESREHFDGRSTVKGTMKDFMDLPEGDAPQPGEPIQKSIEDE